jgi:hypothetical protein
VKRLIVTLFLGAFGIANAWSQTAESVAVFTPLPTQKAKKIKIQKYGGDVIDVGTVDFDYKIEPHTSRGLPYGFSLSLSMPNRELVFETCNEYLESYLSIFVRITKRGEKSGSFFEEKMWIKLNKSEEEALMKSETLYRKLFELSPGVYKIDIIVRDSRSGNSGIHLTGFEIPK